MFDDARFPAPFPIEGYRRPIVSTDSFRRKPRSSLYRVSKAGSRRCFLSFRGSRAAFIRSRISSTLVKTLPRIADRRSFFSATLPTADCPRLLSFPIAASDLDGRYYGAPGISTISPVLHSNRSNLTEVCEHAAI